MTTFEWKITSMDRLTADGFVVKVCYMASAADGLFTAASNGFIEYEQKEGETYTPYNQLTENQVLGWVYESVNKNDVEARLQASIDLQKTPVVESGMPWQNPAS